MKNLIKLVKILFSPFIFVLGFIYFLIFKKNYELIHQSYVKAYCFTSGGISWLCTILIVFIENLNFWKKNVTLGKKSMDVVEIIKRRGYVVLDEKLDESFVAALNYLTKKIKCKSNDEPGKASSSVIFNENLHTESTYRYDELELLEHKATKDVINFFLDLNIAKKYLGSKPHLIGVNMWWSTAQNIPNEFAAQNFHFDLDGIKWLKHFVYLSDVSDENGPHVYVEGTHKVFSKPYSLLKKEYTRITDIEINKYFPKDKIHEITGDKGTIIIGDTSCFHKGRHPTKGKRLIFEITLSNSTFGPRIINNFPINKIYNEHN